MENAQAFNKYFLDVGKILSIGQQKLVTIVQAVSTKGYHHQIQFWQLFSLITEVELFK